jgi:hypothetical protein
VGIDERNSCPKSGRKLPEELVAWHNNDAMDDLYPQELVRHVARSTGLDEATASRVVADVMAYFGQTVEEYVVGRHENLKNRNRKNDDIWPLIVGELKARRFKADELSERQLRRMIYG